MTVSIDIPKHAEDTLRKAFGDALNRTALEALAIEGYRAGKLSRFDVQLILGLESRWETEEWLGDRGVHLNYSLADLESDRDTLESVLGPLKKS
jgi:hypothetical protein